MATYFGAAAIAAVAQQKSKFGEKHVQINGRCVLVEKNMFFIVNISKS